MITIATAVAEAVVAVRDHFAGHPVEEIPDGAGGVFLIVGDVEIGSRYTPTTTWLGFQISAAYPHSDVYPHYIGLVHRRDGQPFPDAVQNFEWRGRTALQLSRRSNRWNPAVDNAALKAEKVITWFVTL
ncbi:E2/UBC family protein [Amycolatopsis sp. lyj-108]|uniref:E2/UBC family protein n=1 Tax=Amycolatopsis sp. lyj-108 TaxID=2789286 RepID=UPI00397CECF9